MKRILFFIPLFLLCTSVYAADQNKSEHYDKADIYNRTDGSNFKDLALLRCIKLANKKLNQPDNKDLNWSLSIFIQEWILFDVENPDKTIKTMNELDRLSEKYIENAGGLMDKPEATVYTFGCLNFYHSDDLEKLMRSFAAEPDVSARDRAIARDKYNSTHEED